MSEIEILKSATLSGFIEKFNKATGIDIREFPKGTKIKAITRNSTYELEIVDPLERMVDIHGSGNFFHHATRAHFSGSTSTGASLLVQGQIALGWSMEINYNGERIITTSVKAIFVNDVPILKSSSNEIN